MSLAELNSNCSSRLRLLVFAHTDMAKRMAFFVCGAVTVSVGRVYGGFQQFYPTQRMNWAPFYVVLCRTDYNLPFAAADEMGSPRRV